MLKNCLDGIVFMNPVALCDKMYLCLQACGGCLSVDASVMQG